MLHSLFCVAAVRVPGPETAAECADVCGSNVRCAGYYFADNASCYRCGPGSDWGATEFVHSSAKSVEWDTPRGCSDTNTCVACPGNSSVLETFADLRVSHATLYLSSSCFYADTNGNNVRYVAGNGTQTIQLYENSSIIGPGIIVNPLHVVGPGVLLTHLHVSHPVHVDALRATLESVTSTVALCAGIAMNAAIGGTIVSNSGGTECGFAAAHASGTITMTSCPQSVPAYVLQERTSDKNPLQITMDSACHDAGNVNLTRLLDAFGTDYETRFYHDGYYGYADVNARKFWNFAVFFLAVNVVFYIIGDPGIL